MVTAWDPEEGRPLGVAFATAKEGDGEHCELRTARKLLSWMPLENATVTADALHCQNETAQDIVARGGEYLLQAKNNRKAVLAFNADWGSGNLNALLEELRASPPSVCSLALHGTTTNRHLPSRASSRKPASK